MQTKTYSLQFLQKRKFFLILPLLVLPFITLLFWALGGGKASSDQAGQLTPKGGLNVELPGAYLKDDKSLDKLSYYEKAASDSAKREESLKADPYFLQQKSVAATETPAAKDTQRIADYRQNPMSKNSAIGTASYSSPVPTDSNEAKVYRKLNELNTALNQATISSNETKDYSDMDRNDKTALNTADVNRLEGMMNRAKNEDNSEDPEMKQLNAVMDKILDVQHPERVKEKIKQTSEVNKGQVFAVRAQSSSDNISLLVSKGSSSDDNFPNNQSISNGFLSIEENVDNDTEQQNAIGAVIHQTQTVVEGAIVKLRLLNDIYVNGLLIPKGSFVFGIASLNGERLSIKINSLRYKNALFPVKLSVVDMDGIEGIYVPGAITRDVAKGSADRTVQGIGLTSLNPSLGAQAASAGIEAVKTLLSRKAKLVKVTIKAGYQVLLQDEKQKASS